MLEAKILHKEGVIPSLFFPLWTETDFYILKVRQMTRINAGIKPAELPDRLLLAELREIKRIPNLVCKGKYSLDGAPTSFKLGTGHVKFFYDKGLYLHNRYIALFEEAVSRGFHPTWFGDCWQEYPENLYNDWTPSHLDRNAVIRRIEERGFTLRPYKALERFKK